MTDDRFYLNYIAAAVLIASLLTFAGIAVWAIYNFQAVPPPIWTPPPHSGGDDFPWWAFILP